MKRISNCIKSGFVLGLTSFSVLVFSSINAQEKRTNLAEKYTHVHKSFEKATCPIPRDNIKHFVYFSRDRESLKEHMFLSSPRFEGAQIMYSWRQLEPIRDGYDFSIIRDDIAYLKQHDKSLFIQLQDATFNPNYKAIPNYLLAQEFDWGATRQYNDNDEPEGWVSKRWNESVQNRFALLLKALGREFDGIIRGINLQETSIGVNQEIDQSFTQEAYLKGLKKNMLAMKKAFPESITLIYANFIPGEWLPFKDMGYLKEIYRYGEDIGVGLGAPDLMPDRKGQLNHALALMHEGQYSVPLGIAVQDGNYIGKTGSDFDYEEGLDYGESTRKNRVPMLHAFAKYFLNIDYIFWSNQFPYIEEDVLSCFN
ncbi:hypothetical protein SAMN03080594_102265 [Arenibacter palladensis]|uniref:Uncharacterized protein n=1 Tax=Arenibacter palladensis TaxID=237373 RepID=A0A1M4Y0K8_9FLAO|nr:hypothetical protein [Arenibacter palladensis]SHE99113.1 hypothetical protein SAMN03080594_102265 [Arenibacter palladensis]